MKKKHFTTFSIILGIVFLLFLILNFGLNFWLKKKLPDYIKNNSHYFITYKNLNVDLGNGNIDATGITINNKTPNNPSALGLQGTIDTLTVSRLGIYNFLFKKNISTSDFTLRNPNLNIILAKPVDNKTDKGKNVINFKNLQISNGNIKVFRHTRQKLFSVEALDLKIKNLQFTEKSTDEELPIAFEEYHIAGKSFFFRPDPLYVFTAKYITTHDGEMKVKNFALIPLLSYQNFLKYYPKKQNLLAFKASEISLKNFMRKGKELSAKSAGFENPELTFYTTSARSENKKQSTNYSIRLENIFFNNGNINILKPTETPLFVVKKANLKMRGLVINEETLKESIPFKYENFDVKGENLNYVSDHENVKIAEWSVNPKSADFKKISVKPTVILANKTTLDIAAENINLKINEWKLSDHKLKLNIESLLVNQLNGKISTAKITTKNKPSFDGLEFPLNVKNTTLKNANLIIDHKNQPLVFKNLNVNIRNMEMNEKTIKNTVPFQIENYSISAGNFNYKTKFYNLSAAFFKISKNTVQFSDFIMKPTVSRAQYIRMIPSEKDLYDIKINHINGTGKWDLVSENKYLNLENITFNQADALIFRSKIPKDDQAEKPMYSRLLRSIKFPVFIQNLELKNSLLIYEEDTKKSDGPGKLIFNNFNMNVKNLNSGKTPGKPTYIPINIQCKFMNISPMNVKWSFDTANKNDAFAISGNIADLPASEINPFIEPYLKIRATGLISDLIFNFKGTNKGIGGILNMDHQNLKIAILKSTGEKDKILSAVANIFVKSNSGNQPTSVKVESVERDPAKSFFNLFWRGIEQGLKKTLIGKNAPKAEQSIKKTVENTKTALEQNKSDLKETKAEVKEKVEEIKIKVEEKKEKNVFKKIFNKKSEN